MLKKSFEVNFYSWFWSSSTTNASDSYLNYSTIKEMTKTTAAA